MRYSDNSEAGLLVRPLDLADVTFLTDLWVASWREAMPEIDFAARRDWIAGFIADPVHDTRVASNNEVCQGFVTWEAAYIHQLVVAPVVKGKGVAAKLLDTAKDASPSGLDLDVNQANERAVRFYVREGFVTTGAGTNRRSGLATWHMRWTGS